MRGGRRGGRDRVKECTKLMVRKDTNGSRKWGGKDWKEKVGDVKGDRKGD